MSSPTEHPDGRSPAVQPILPDEVLENIFLHLDDAADLARASATCACFRRVVSGFRFLRRYRSLHPPPVLGLLDYSSSNNSNRGFHQAQLPRRSAPAARAFAEAADFSFSFLPSDPRCWHVRDFRDGRFLLSRCTTATRFFSEVLVVCDPLHRRYIQIPGIPAELAASTGLCGKEIFDPFLAPAGQDKGEPSIQLICNVLFNLTIRTFVFSSTTGKWRYVTVTPFSIANYWWMECPVLLLRCYASNCFYWMENRYSSKPVLVLDIQQMKFSTIHLPPKSKGRDKIIVEAEGGRLCLFILDGNKLSRYYCKPRHDNAIRAEDWELDREITLPVYNFLIISKAEAEGHILLRGFPTAQHSLWRFREEKPDAHCFTVDIHTLLVEKLCVLKYESSPDYLYANFPPPLSPPSI